MPNPTALLQTDQITVWQNTERNLRFAVQDASYTVSNGIVTTTWNPYTLINVTPLFYLKSAATAADGSPVGFSTIYDVNNGIVNVNLQPATIATPGTQWYRLDLVLADTNKVTVAAGPFVVKAA
jgi:hypothetical protein